MKTALRIYRIQAGLTSEQLGQKLGVQKSTISKWENGRIPAERVLDIERAIGVSRCKLRPDIYPPDCVEIPTDKAA